MDFLTAIALLMQTPATTEAFDPGAALWPAGARSPYEAPPAKKYNKHDFVKIQVVERTSGAINANSTSDKRSRWETEIKDFMHLKEGFSGGFPFRLAEGVVDEDPAINIDSRYRQDHRGRTNRQFDLTFTIMAEVIDVRPNGNLVVEAKKERTINDEVESIKITGEAAPASVVNGAVKSEDIMNLMVAYSGDGGVSDAVQPGFLGWLLNEFWPF